MPSVSDISHPIHARLYDRLNRRAEERLFPPHREYLTADLRGKVLDIGIGTGSMIPYYADSRDRGGQLDLHAVEPEPNMRNQAIDAAEGTDLPISIIQARAENLPYPDETFDIVICSLVLCSVEQVDTVLSEVRRVLRGDGEFRFFEHIQSEGLRGTIEAVVSPVWRPLVAGCHIDRRTHERIERQFTVSDIEDLDIGNMDTFPVRRFVRGYARPAPPGACAVTDEE